MGFATTGDVAKHIAQLNTGRNEGSETLCFSRFAKGILNQCFIYQTIYGDSGLGSSIPGVVSTAATTTSNNPLRASVEEEDEEEEGEEEGEGGGGGSEGGGGAAGDAAGWQKGGAVALPNAPGGKALEAGALETEIGKQVLEPPFLVERPATFPDATLTVHIYRTLDAVEGGMGMMLKKMMPAAEARVGDVMKSTATSTEKKPAWDEALVFARPDMSTQVRRRATSGSRATQLDLTFPHLMIPKDLVLSLVNNSNTSKNLGGRNLGDATYGEWWARSEPP